MHCLESMTSYLTAEIKPLHASGCKLIIFQFPTSLFILFFFIFSFLNCSVCVQAQKGSNSQYEDTEKNLTGLSIGSISVSQILFFFWGPIF